MSTGIVTYPGVNSVRRMRYTRTNGTVPDVVTLEVIPQTNDIASIGNLSFSFNGTTVTIPQCRVDRGSLKVTPRGTVIGLQLFDRRWHWRFRHVSGYYNQRYSDGNIRSDSLKTPQELATILLQAMGEAVFDVSLMPNNVYPEVDWDYASATYELELLCRSLGCTIVLGLDNIVYVVPYGYGAGLPNNSDVRSIGYGVDPPESPDQIIVVGGLVTVQSKLELEAVGLDTDGEVKLLDDLSYVPTAATPPLAPLGLDGQPGNFAGVGDEHGEDAMRLARKTVRKWYRVKQQADGTTNIPGFTGDYDGIWQILPLNKVKIDKFQDSDGIFKAQPATLEGVYYDLSIPGNTAEGTPVVGEWTLDRERGIVKLADETFKQDTSNSDIRLPAELYLETSYHVQHADTKQYFRFETGLTLGNNGFGASVIRRLDLAQLFVARYSDTTPTEVASVENNTQALTDTANTNLSAAAAQYTLGRSYDIEYRGIQSIGNNGKILQVTWEMDFQRGFKTWGYLNSEGAPGVMPYAARRRLLEGRDVDNRGRRRRRKRKDI